MTGELDMLMEMIGHQGFVFPAFGPDRDGPEVLAAVRDFGGCADVVILIDEHRACAYRTPTGPGIDVFSPSQVSWSYAAGPVWTLRAVVTLAPPGHPEAPDTLTQAPPGLDVPAVARIPVRVRHRGRGIAVSAGHADRIGRHGCRPLGAAAVGSDMPTFRRARRHRGRWVGGLPPAGCQR